MSLKPFLYYILKEDGRSAKVVNGVVTYTGVPTPLPQVPDDGGGMQIAWERSLTDHGLNRNFSLPFGYVRDGLRIIRDALYNQSIEEKILLLIQTLTLVLVPGISYNWLYDYLYRGEIDLSAAEDSVDMINVPCMEGGLHKLLKAGRATKYTYPFDVEAVTVYNDGIILDANGHYVVAGTISNETFFNKHTIPITFVNSDGVVPGTAYFTQEIQDVVPDQATYFGASTNYFIINNSGASKTYNIKGTVKWMCTDNSASLSYRWRLTKQNNTHIDVYNSTVAGAIIVGLVYNVPVDINFTLANGEKMFFWGEFFGAGGVAIVADFLEGSELDVTFDSRGAASFIKGYKKSTLYRKLIGSITGDENNASSALCTLWDYIILTSGDAIRGLTDAQITTSLDDFKQDVDATFMAGLAVANDKVELEARERYYDDSNPIDLGTIKDLVISPAVDFIANKFKHGHIKPDIEDINGRYDPNGSNEFTGPYTKVVADYSMVSQYKAGSLEIESLRLNLDGKVTTDDNRDSSVYVMNCLPAAAIQTVLLSFVSSGNYIVFPLLPVVAIGTKFKVTGSVSNDGTYEVTNVIYGIAQTVYTNVTITIPEFVVSVTVEFMGGQVLTLNRPTYTTLDGVPNATIYNLPNLTPKAMLLAHWRWIKSMHYGLELFKLVFNSGGKNTELLTVLAGVTIDEDADVPLDTAGSVLFLPFIATFLTEVPIDLVSLLEANPNRCFTAYDEQRDVQITGFNLLAGLSVSDRKEQEFRLLLSPENDLTLLL